MTRLGTPDAALEIHTDPTGPVVAAAPAPAKSSKPQTTREFERALRGLGFSQREAAGIALHGFKATDNTVESTTNAELSELAALLAKTSNFLKDSK